MKARIVSGVTVGIALVKKLYGAVAYLKIDDKARELADQKGLLIIRSTHSNKTIVNPKTKLRDYTPNPS